MNHADYNRASFSGNAQLPSLTPSSTHKLPLPDVSSAKMYARLLSFVRPYWKAFALALLAMVLLAATEPLFPALMKTTARQRLLPASRATTSGWHRSPSSAFSCCAASCRFVSDYTMAWVTNRVVMDLRIVMFDRVLRLPTRYYDNQSTGALMSQASPTT